jgi:hypothetical protein
LDRNAWELLLPEGILEYFEVTGVTKGEEGYTISLAEKHLTPSEYKGRKLVSHGFMDEVTISDFPIRGKACFLVVKRRRWLDEQTRETVTRDWHLVAKGTRLTQEFATFLKGMYR